MTSVLHEAGLRIAPRSGRPRPSVAELSVERGVRTARRRPRRGRTWLTNPRVLFVGRSRYRLPLAGLAGEEVGRDRGGDRLPGARRRRAAARRRAASASGFAAPARPRVLDGAALLPAAPVPDPAPDRRASSRRRSSPPTRSSGRRRCSAAAWRRLRHAGDRRGARRLAHVHAALRLDPPRGSRSPSTDRVSTYVLRRADATRGLSAFTSGLDRGGARASLRRRRSRPTATSRRSSAEPVAPLPERPVALFVGMLEAYKNIDGLAAAWRRVAASVPDAALVIVGKGTRRQVVDELAARPAGSGRVPRAAASGRGRGQARRCDGARPAVVAGGARAGRSSRRSPAGVASSRRRAGGVLDLVDERGRGHPRSRPPTRMRSSPS